ncbi:MAG: glycoside hydrolase family 88 protein [Steroidobacter sp.]
MNNNPMRALLCAMLMFMCCLANARPDFDHWPPGLSPQQIGNKVAVNFLNREHLLHPDNNTIHYAESVAWYGALDFADQVHDSALLVKLQQRFAPLMHEDSALIPPANHVDFSVFGVVPLQLYLLTADVRYRTLGLAFADAQWDRPLDNGLTSQTRYWIDDMYMITALQTAAYRATHDEKYADRAAREMASYLKKLQQPNGLFHHSLESPFFWGRGNGWVAAGMTELLRVLPERHPLHAAILRSYKKMMAALLKYQSPSGLWRQLIDHNEAWEETSGSAMFTFALVVGVDHGWLDEKTYGPAARKAWLALAGKVNDDGLISDVCVGTGAKNDLQHYLNRPRTDGDLHGQAPLLWTAAALIRAGNK